MFGGCEDGEQSSISRRPEKLGGLATKLKRADGQIYGQSAEKAAGWAEGRDEAGKLGAEEMVTIVEGSGGQAIK